MEKMKMHTPDMTQDHIARIRELFPNCVTEAKDAQGQIKLAVDFDLLRQELSGQIVEGPQERYHLNWPGKREALLTANAPIAKTLRPARNESVNFDTTKNLFIEGDNLEALKLLQETYLGKIKMIYIDPPYNTGNDFIYEDDFAEDVEDFLLKSNQRDETGTRLVANTEANGRFHSDWLTQMYSRLKLARNLLKENGLLFVSIDDNESANIQKLGTEIFGDNNFLGTLTWVKRTKPINSGDAKFQIQKRLEYVHVFCRDKNRPNTYAFKLPEAGKREYNFEGKHGKCRIKDIEDSDVGGKKRDTMKFPILGLTPEKGKRWKIGKDEADRLIEMDRVRIIDGKVKVEIYPQDEEGIRYYPFWSHFDEKQVSSAEQGKAELNALMEAKLGFDTVKPTDLLTQIIRFVPLDDEDIVMDFYSGTCTTADAIIQFNALQQTNFRFMMVQYPEPCAQNSDPYKAGFKTIAEISKERIRRAGKKIQEENPLFKGDVGFRVLKIDTSNMADIYYVPDAVKQSDLLKSVDNIKPDRTPEDLLFQVIIDWGSALLLTAPIAREKLAGKQVYFVDGNAMAACFDTGISEDFVKELAARKPLRVVFRDNGFASDSVKINAEQIFRQISPTTDMKTL